MMKFLVALAFLAVTQARIIKPACNLIGKNIGIYEKDVLKDNVGEPYQMVIDYSTNTLFFSYSAPNPVNDEGTFKSAFLNLKTGEYNTIPGIKGGFAATVDNNNHKVYLGGRNGIYEYDYATKKATHINPNGYSIWQLFAKNTLYYVAYPQFRVYTYENGNSVMIPELRRTMVSEVAVDNNDNLYFSNSSGLFLLNKEDKEMTKLGNFNVNSFTADINGNVYFSTPSGLYNIDHEHNVNEIANIDGVFGVVVEENNNLIYGAGNQILRLKINKGC